MERYLRNIDQQIEFNKGKNILLDENDLSLKFVDDTINAILKIKDIRDDSEKILIDYAVDKALEEFCRMNQYYTFNSSAKNELRIIYSDLFSSIKTNENTIETISKNHYKCLKQWLLKTNPFAEKIYTHADLDIKPVACSEYSVELQMTVLKIDLKTIMEPVLDIGCGKQGHFVNYLCKQGIEAKGIDRFSISGSNLTNDDWLEYNYGMNIWGTVISHLGFSNHFKHHHLREDGNYIEYAKKYMQILKSLKRGGRFHYAPDVPFIELHLDNSQFQIERHEIGESDFQTTVITRLK